MQTTPRIDAALAASKLAEDNHIALLRELDLLGTDGWKKLAALSAEDHARVDASDVIRRAAEREYAKACRAAGWR